MSKHVPNAAGSSITQSLGQSVTALVHEITRLKHDLTALRARLNVDAESLPPREMLLCLEDVAQWMGIATEMEHSYEKQSKNTRSGGRERSLDLEAARLSIGGKLDRLRAAAGAERVSERVE